MKRLLSSIITLIILLSIITLIILLPGLQQSTAGRNFIPLELVDPPVNGTDQSETPLHYRNDLGFGPRVAFKIVEHGDTTFFDEELNYLETPHIDWAAPYANGPVRVLFIANPQRQLRHPIELMQRSDFDITILQIPAVLGEYSGNRDETLEKIRENIRATLAEEFDVILVTSATPDFVLEIVKTKVEHGAGVVMLHNFMQWWRHNYEGFQELSPLNFGYQGTSGLPTRTKVQHPVTEGLSLACWPMTGTHNGSADDSAKVLVKVNNRPIVAVGHYGETRTVGIYYHAEYWGGMLPRSEENSDAAFSDSYEPVYALFLRAIAWAANREPRVQVSAPEIFSTTAAIPGQLVLNASGPALTDDNVTIRCTIRDPWGNVEADHLTAKPSGKKDGAFVIDLPPVYGNGRHRLDWWAMNGEQVENWGCVAIDVAGGPVLSVEPLQEITEPGGLARYRITTDTGGTLQVKGIDDADRVFFTKTVPLASTADIAVDVAASRLPRNRVVFRLFQDDRKVAQKVVELAVPRLGVDSMQGEYCFAVYGDTLSEDHLTRYVGCLYRAVGLNTFYANWHSRGRSRNHYLTGMYSISGAMAPYIKQSDFSKELASCPNKPEVRAKWTENIAKAKDDFRAYGGIGRVLDDEAFHAYVRGNEGAQVCQCKYCLAAFRATLRNTYDTVPELNKAWGTAFPDWDAVRPLEEEDVAGSDNPTGWLEFRVFMNHVYAQQYYGWIQEQHADLDTSYGVGPGAPQHGGIYHGSNHALRPVLKFMMLYGPADYPDAFMGAPGAQKYEPPLNWQQLGPWSALLRGADALWFYAGNMIIGPELAWRKHAEWIENGIHDIREGVGVLIRDAEPIQPQVLIYDSIEQEGMRWLFTKREDEMRILGSMATAHSVRGLLGRHGIPFGHIRPGEIAQGKLTGCKLLILSGVTNMDDDTADAIRDYVRNGGCVLADVLPATRKAMGTPREKSPLTDLFDSAVFEGPRAGLPAGVAQGSTPVYTLKSAGAGHTVSLGYVINDRNETTAPHYQALADKLITLVGLYGTARIVDVDTGERLPHRPLYIFNYGKATLLGSIRGYLTWAANNPRLIDRDADGPETARFTWKEAKHTYNVRTGDYLGFTNNAVVDLPSFQGRLLALLPYKVKGLELDIPRKARAGETIKVHARILTERGTPDAHVLRMNVESPTGHRVPLYARTGQGSNGQATFTLPFAFNDRRGTWQITIRDVMSGTEQTERIRLE